jgi:hypothetical protein
VKIRARAVEHATLPVLLKRDLEAMSAQMSQCSRVLVVCDGEGMMHTAMVVGHRIERRIMFYQDEAMPAASRKAMSPRGTVDKCLQPTISV